jgi:hypothetical protein
MIPAEAVHLLDWNPLYLDVVGVAGSLRRMADFATSRPVFSRNSRLDHETLRFCMRVSLRRGTWAGLSVAEKGLYRCGLWVAKTRGTISNIKLSVTILNIITKLMTTIKSHICRLGLARARALWKNYLSNGVFDWAPEALAHFSRTEYITYLGVMELNG